MADKNSERAPGLLFAFAMSLCYAGMLFRVAIPLGNSGMTFFCSGNKYILRDRFKVLLIVTRILVSFFFTL